MWTYRKTAIHLDERDAYIHSFFKVVMWMNPKAEEPQLKIIWIKHYHSNSLFLIDRIRFHTVQYVVCLDYSRIFEMCLRHSNIKFDILHSTVT